MSSDESTGHDTRAPVIAIGPVTDREAAVIDHRPEVADREPSASRGPAVATGPVITRAVRVLKTFSPTHPSLTLSEIARHSGLPLTTTHRLVTALTETGMVERDAGGRYHVGLKLWEIASLAPRGLGLRELALPYMEDLYEVTRENVQLAVRDGAESVFVERIAGSGAVHVLTRVGGRFPLHPTGVGRVLLAFAPPHVQNDVLSAPLERLTPMTVTSAKEIRAILAQVRAQGYAITDRQVTMDSVSVAAPVLGRAGDIVAAVSIVVTAGTASAIALAPAVQATARGISRAVRSSVLLQ